ncbi:MAG: GNAT family N-acetyltransferase [Oscillospiraceae bacterium]|nr:GNAT family N-acetyltransferase [Oscillospiraceae bacterium]
MIRYFENQDKYGVLELAAQYNGDDFDLGTFAGMFDNIVNKTTDDIGIAILHAGEYLGYCTATTSDNTVTVNQLYIKPEFQKKKVAPQVFDFIEENFPDYNYRAVIPTDNAVALKVFSNRDYKLITK